MSAMSLRSTESLKASNHASKSLRMRCIFSLCHIVIMRQAVMAAIEAITMNAVSMVGCYCS